MNTGVAWLVELAVRPGRENDLQGLVDDMASATRTNEPGTLTYEWSTSADGSVCHILERYHDSAAVLAHLAAFGEKFASRFLDILTPTRFVVYGSPSQEVKAAMAGFNPTYMQSVGGFRR